MLQRTKSDSSNAICSTKCTRRPQTLYKSIDGEREADGVARAGQRHVSVLIKPDSDMKPFSICLNAIVSNRAGMPCIRQTSAHRQIYRLTAKYTCFAAHAKGQQ